MVTSLTTGPPNTILQNVVYALPPRRVMVFSDAAVETSNQVNGTFTALTGANTTGVETAGGFIRCTTGNTVVRCKA